MGVVEGGREARLGILVSYKIEKKLFSVFEQRAKDL